QLGGGGKPREYTLVMRRLPETRMLPALLDSGQLTDEMMQSVAEVLGDFHSHAEPLEGVEISHHLANVEREWNNNLADLNPLVGRFMDAEGLKRLEFFGAGFLTQNTELFRRRAAQSRIRDVHGDLHCEHVCFAPEGVQIYDCIEFDAKLRRCDLASEVAFLLMDLKVRGGSIFRAPFLKRYFELVNDSEMSDLLPFYECYRALVRGKVEALRPQTAETRAPRYFRYASEISCRPLDHLL
ncbi:MAG TPA: phosphotransferase, partial [Candidatus Polarisedimenticolaceae bacterium]|nr:phosphotransferase [Candidatus Polarisedimenticolaceae bacterium]